MNEEVKEKVKVNLQRLKTTIKWFIFALLSGIFIGVAASIFRLILARETEIRQAHSFLILFLPAGGLLIVFLYRMLKDENDTGTNLVLKTIQSGGRVPFRMAPAIFFSTLITHLFGGSVGREGAALQFGGSIGGTLGRFFRFDEKDQHIMIMCGMSAAFSALFGTPMTAAFFSMEVVTVGIMHYAALLPCVIASLSARSMSYVFGLDAEFFDPGFIPAVSASSLGFAVLLAILAGLVSILFCVALHRSEWLFSRLFKNPYLRIVIGGAAIVGLTALVGDQTYNGTGVEVIEHCMNGSVAPYAFLLKILFTAITIGAGFKGGEIIPSLFIGAAFGNLFASVFGFSSGICAAVGMTGLFCGVTNCPVTALLLSFELFGFAGMPYYLIAVAVSYVMSGYFGLYKSQKIMYSKFKTSFINRKTH